MKKRVKKVVKRLPKLKKIEEKRECKLSQVPKGEYFRFPGKKKVYIAEGGGPVKGFDYCAADDINGWYSTKTDRTVEVGFGSADDDDTNN